MKKETKNVFMLKGHIERIAKITDPVAIYREKLMIECAIDQMKGEGYLGKGNIKNRIQGILTKYIEKKISKDKYLMIPSDKAPIVKKFRKNPENIDDILKRFY